MSETTQQTEKSNIFKKLVTDVAIQYKAASYLHAATSFLSFVSIAIGNYYLSKGDPLGYFNISTGIIGITGEVANFPSLQKANPSIKQNESKPN